VKKVREVQRERRNKDNIPKVALVGYTNAGKSTLRNRLCDIAIAKDAVTKEKVFEADMLFATLDTTTRAITLPDNRLITLTDTVGFIRKLPHDLVEAFKSTLEEVIFSDLLVHVVDSSSDHAIEQIIAVEEVLKELNALDTPSILVLNKVDKAQKEAIEAIKSYIVESDMKIYEEIIEISATEGLNLDFLLNKLSMHLPYSLKEIEYIIPYSNQAAVAYLHRNANVLLEEYKEDGTYIKAEVDDEVYNKTKEFEM
jgi:GTP-binding protein HflX